MVWVCILPGKKFFLRGALNQTQSKSKFEKHVSCSEDLHKNKSQNETLKTRIRLIISYHRGAPNVSSITKKHWSILEINDNLSTSFENTLLTCFKQISYLGELTGSNEYAKVKWRRDRLNKLKWDNVEHARADGTHFVAIK